MSQNEQDQVPGAVQALRDLKTEVNSPEDHQVLAEWKREVGSERAKALGEMASRGTEKEFVQVDNSLAPQEDVASARAGGQEMSNDRPMAHSDN